MYPMIPTVPMKFEGTPTLTPAKLSILNQWYTTTLRYADESKDFIDSEVYRSVSECLEDTLQLLYRPEVKIFNRPEVKAAAQAAKRSGGSGKKLLLIGVVAGTYYVWNKKNKEIREIIRNNTSGNGQAEGGKKEYDPTVYRAMEEEGSKEGS